MATYYSTREDPAPIAECDESHTSTFDPENLVPFTLSIEKCLAYHKVPQRHWEEYTAAILAEALWRSRHGLYIKLRHLFFKARKQAWHRFEEQLPYHHPTLLEHPAQPHSTDAIATRRLLQALATCPSWDQRLFLRWAVEEWTLRELAEHYQQPFDTIAARLDLTRLTLRRAIGLAPTPRPPFLVLHDDDKARFTRYLQPDGGCLLWTGPLHRNSTGRPYPLFHLHRAAFSATMIMYQMHYGRPPVDTRIVQACHNILCLAPAQLYPLHHKLHPLGCHCPSCHVTDQTKHPRAKNRNRNLLSSLV